MRWFPCRWRWINIFIFCLVPGLTACESPATAVQVFCYERTPRVEQVIKGIEQELGVTNLPVLEAGGNWQRGQELVQQLAQEDLALLIVLSTPALSLAAPNIKQRPLIVFGMVADPYFSGAAYDTLHPEDHQGNITGIASPPPVATALKQGSQLFPAYRCWGLLFDPLEGSSIELCEQFKQLAPDFGLTPVVQPASSETEAQTGLRALKAQGVRLVYIPPDQNARRYAPLLLRWGQEQKLLVVNGHPEFSAPGAILSVTTDYQAVGKLTAALARRVQAGEFPAQIPIQHETPIHVKGDERLLEKWSGYPPTD
ncbi:MAG: ABC transporter substrate binding protein [Desulfobacca sp.]|nr:ABC transporter substrate binding protein [Desulfobacca sp.]